MMKPVNPCAGARFLSAIARTCLVLIHCAAAGADSRPNIIVILADDIGYSDLSCFGSEIPTPNLDKLAHEGVRFTQFYNTARCCPSRAALLTGLYPHNAGVGHMLHHTEYPGYTEQLTTNCATIAEVLHTAGYTTYMCGKWHQSPVGEKQQSGWPRQRGFDHYYGTLQGAGSYYDPATLTRDNMFITPENDPEYHTKRFYYTDALGDNAIQFLKKHHDGSPEKPFFLYLAFTAAHWPLHAPEDEIAKHKGKYDAGYDAIRQARIKRQKELGLLEHVTTPSITVGDWDKVENKAWEARCMEVYAAQITCMDTNIGKLVDFLNESRMLDNTVVMFMQDNGGCAEDFGHEGPKPLMDASKIKPMGPNDLQKQIWPPMQTRDGRPVRSAPGVMPGPADTFQSYWEHWANVSDTPFRYYKHYVHEGGISTPLIVHWPTGLQKRADTVVSTPAHLIDIMPTCAELAGTTYPKVLEGRSLKRANGVSLVGALRGETLQRGAPIFWEHESNRAVRDGKWKIVAREGNPWELYDMDVDRAETHDLAADHPDMVKKMARQWDDYAAKNNVLPLGGWKVARSRNPTLHYKLHEHQVLNGDQVPNTEDTGVSITAQLEAPIGDGVLVAQGGLKHGYSIYVRDGVVHFAVRRDDQLNDLASTTSVAGTTGARILARLDIDGKATLDVNGAESSAQFGGRLLAVPVQGLDVGTDSGDPVGEYPHDFQFKGKIGVIELDLLRPKR